jgi:hypothetical protein
MNRFAIHLAAGLFLCLSLLLAVSTPRGHIVAPALVIIVVAIVSLGSERVGVGFLGLAFATAPMYKGLAPAGTVATPTDVCLVVGFSLLLPRLLSHRFTLPVSYVAPIAVITAAGFIGSMVSTTPTSSLLALGFWLATLFALPAGVHLWRPSRGEIQAMVWAFVIGHLISTLAGLALGHTSDGRLYGLTNHPNYFAESGVIAFGLLLHLLATSAHRVLVWVALVVTVYSVYLSGSRAGTLALATLIAIIPLVERSAFKAYLIALVGAVGAIVLSLEWSVVAGSGSLARLTGKGSAEGSDFERSRGLSTGWHRFLDHPLTGSGLVDLFDVHNNYLEAAIGVGVFGLIAFLVVLWTLGKPLFGQQHLRRLCYTVAGYAVFGATTPALYDRTYWVAMSLSIVVVASHSSSSQTSPPSPARRSVQSPSWPSGQRDVVRPLHGVTQRAHLR